METIGIELTRLFVKVVQHGSYSRAAEVLRVPKSTISKAITKLEIETGTKLLVRTTRSQTLTTAGRLFYETCLGPIQILEDAQKSLFGQDNIVSGKIKVTAPEDLGNLHITPTLARLCLKYPKLDFETLYTNDLIDLVKDGFDLGIRIGQLKESSLKQRRVGDIELILVAAPSFIRSKKINHPHDLKNLDALVLRTQGLSHWSLHSERKTAKVTVHARMICNQMSSLISAITAGAGVAIVPSYLVNTKIKNEELIHLLPNWTGHKLPVSIVSPMSMNSSSRLHIVTEELISAFRNVFLS